MGAAAKWDVKYLVSSATGFSSREGSAQVGMLEDWTHGVIVLWVTMRKKQWREGGMAVNLTPTPELSQFGGAGSLEVRRKQEDP